MMNVICMQVDAFTQIEFKGNPAAVCFLEEEKQDVWLQSLATEFNLSETCYLTPLSLSDDSAHPRFLLRWFTPVTEVPFFVFLLYLVLWCKLKGLREYFVLVER